MQKWILAVVVIASISACATPRRMHRYPHLGFNVEEMTREEVGEECYTPGGFTDDGKKQVRMVRGPNNSRIPAQRACWSPKEKTIKIRHGDWAAIDHELCHANDTVGRPKGLSKEKLEETIKKERLECRKKYPPNR